MEILAEDATASSHRPSSATCGPAATHCIARQLQCALSARSAARDATDPKPRSILPAPDADRNPESAHLCRDAKSASQRASCTAFCRRKTACRDKCETKSHATFEDPPSGAA